MKKSALLALALSGAIVSGVFASPQIGEKAPAVKVSKWMNRQPPALPGEKGSEKQVFIVEFWATWCQPCLRCIPHMAELYRKHEKDGLVIIGVSNEEPETIQKFLEKNANGKLQMPYFVACDEEMTTTESWMKDIEGIPHAFIVDRGGNIVWSGNPLGDMTVMDETIRLVLAGKYDLNAAKQASAAAKKYETGLEDLKVAFAAADKEKVFKVLDELIALKPLELHPYMIRRQMLIEFDMKDQLPAWIAKTEAAMQDSADGLRQLVALELSKALHERDPGLMLRCATRANELSKGRDAETLAILAEVQCGLGMIEPAIATQKQAVALVSDEFREEFEGTLSYYEKGRALAKQSVVR